MPIWELASRLETLSIGGSFPGDWNHDNFESFIDGFVTDYLLHPLELLSEPCSRKREAVLATVWRTIATAARGGRLKRLRLGNLWNVSFWKPFAVRALLPAWIGVEEWDLNLKLWDATDWTQRRQPWEFAAAVLRRALFHMSHSEFTEREVLIAGRRLQGGEVQSMHDEFKRNGLPLFCAPQADDDSRSRQAKPLMEEMPFVRYLIWLRDDAELAQQVADAWNDVVPRGGADLLQCHCRKCLA